MTPKYSHLMSPLVIRGKVLKNRLAASNSLPHFLQGPEPYPADTVIAHYENKAKSAAIVTCMGINNFTRGKQLPMFLDFGHFPDFDLYDTNCQNYLMQLADSIHFYDSLACMGLFVGPPSAYPLMKPKQGHAGKPDGNPMQGHAGKPDENPMQGTLARPDEVSKQGTEGKSAVISEDGPVGDPDKDLKHELAGISDEKPAYSEQADEISPFDQTKSLQAPPPVEFDIEKIPAHELPAYYSVSQLNDIADSYAEQAGILQMLDYDMISIHMCYNGQLPAKMFSPLLNTRTDEFGGSLENRMRFPLMVLERVRRKVGPRMIIEIQWSPEEAGEGGYTMEDSIAFLNEAKKYADIVQLRYKEVDLAHPISFELQHTPFLHYGETVKKNVPGIIVGVIGGFHYPEDCEAAIEEGKADLIYAARAFISNPDYGQLVLEGRDDDIVPCLRCNKCHGRGEHDPFVSVCSVNPLIGLEQKIGRMQIPTKGGKRVALIGGGPASMRCAMYLQDRGHIPVIYEKGPQLGGAIIHSDYADFKWTLRDYKNFLIHQMEKNGIEIHLNTEATPEMISSLGYDVVIAATGASPVLLPVPGADPEKITFCQEAFAHPEKLGNRIVIIGGGEVGCELGIYLARRGKQATILEMRDRLSADSTAIHYYSMFEAAWQAESNFHGITGATVTAIRECSVEYKTRDGSTLSVAADSVIMAAGMRPNQKQALAFYGSAPEFYMIGDCKAPATVQQATRQAYATAMRI